MAKLQVYAGDGFEVTYDPKVCAHAGECVRGLPAVFDSKASPWMAEMAESETASSSSHAPSSGCMLVNRSRSRCSSRGGMEAS